MRALTRRLAPAVAPVPRRGVDVGIMRPHTRRATTTGAAAPAMTRAVDYQRPPYTWSHVSLDFDVQGDAARARGDQNTDGIKGVDDVTVTVTARMQVSRNADGAVQAAADTRADRGHEPDPPLVLNGNDEYITLRSVRVGGHALDASEGEYELAPGTLSIPAAVLRRAPESSVGRNDGAAAAAAVEAAAAPEAAADLTAPREVEVEVSLRPAANTALMGMFSSGDMVVTQMEAHGFRNMLYSLDRPDVQATYDVHVEADARRFPVLLSNGNIVSKGKVDGTDGERHWIKWRDPWRKPTYLFAVVAGDLDCFRDTYITCSGTEVSLRIYCEHGYYEQCAHAMRSLKAAMRFDEEVFGLEYDLGVYNVVVSQHMTMGAMENKSLNVFNSKYVLADPATATDADYAAIESVVAHEYLHNYTGNRVTCRDWLQLSLKEGLTVYRDQLFSAHMYGPAGPTIKRIQDVTRLRAAQFPEDAGPSAHPIRPEGYMAVDNLYTATVYEKGAEVVRMLQTMLGWDAFRRGFDHYIRTHDGSAATCEDWVASFEAAPSNEGVDLTQFRRWYSQKGTPEVSVSGVYDEAARTLTLDVTQTLPESAWPADPDADAAAGGISTAARKHPDPLHIPLAVGLLDADGNDIAVLVDDDGANNPTMSAFGAASMAERAEHSGTGTALLHVRELSQQFVLRDVNSEPVLSLARGFSAPIRVLEGPVRVARSGGGGQPGKGALQRQLHRVAHDSDGFNRWDAMQAVFVEAVARRVRGDDGGVGSGGGDGDEADAPLHDAVRSLLVGAVSGLVDPGANPASAAATADSTFTALMLTPPSVPMVVSELASRGGGAGVDPVRVARAHQQTLAGIARAVGPEMASAFLHADALLRDISDASGSGATHNDEDVARIRGLRSLHGSSLMALAAPAHVHDPSALHEVAVVASMPPRSHSEDATLDVLAAAEDLVVRPSAREGSPTQIHCMTTQMAGLATAACLSEEHPVRERCMASFETQWQHETLVADKLLRTHAATARHAGAVRALLTSDSLGFSLTVPNKVYTLGGFFFGNPGVFHAHDGSGYELLADVVRDVDAVNPAVAARLAGAFGSVSDLATGSDAVARMRGAMRSVLDAAPSANVREIVGAAEGAAGARMNA